MFSVTGNPLFGHGERHNGRVIEGNGANTALCSVCAVGLNPAGIQLLFNHLVLDRLAADGPGQVLPRGRPPVVRTDCLGSVCIGGPLPVAVAGTVLELKGHTLGGCSSLRDGPLLDSLNLRRLRGIVQSIGHGPVVLRLIDVGRGIGAVTCVVGIFHDGGSIHAFERVVAVILPGLELTNPVFISPVLFIHPGQVGDGVRPALVTLGISSARAVPAVQLKDLHVLPRRLALCLPLEHKPGLPGHDSIPARAGVIEVFAVLPDLPRRHRQGGQPVGAGAAVGGRIVVEGAAGDDGIFAVRPIIEVSSAIVVQRDGQLGLMRCFAVADGRLHHPVFEEDVLTCSSVRVLDLDHRRQAGEGIVPYSVCHKAGQRLGTAVVAIGLQSRLNAGILLCRFCGGYPLSVGQCQTVHPVAVHGHLQFKGHGQLKAQIVPGKRVAILVRPHLCKIGMCGNAVGQIAKIVLSVLVDVLQNIPFPLCPVRRIDMVSDIILTAAYQLQPSLIGHRFLQGILPRHTVGGVNLKAFATLGCRLDRKGAGATVPFTVTIVGYDSIDGFRFNTVPLARLSVRTAGQGEQSCKGLRIRPETVGVVQVIPGLGGGEGAGLRLVILVEEGGLGRLGIFGIRHRLEIFDYRFLGGRS